MKPAPKHLTTDQLSYMWGVTKKTVIISTPTTEDGQITRELSICDDVFDYHAPCPHCGKMQILQFSQIKWPKDLDRKDPAYAMRVRESAWYECESCLGEITDLQIPEMLQGGEWVARKQGRKTPRSVGFSLPSFYSPWLTWGDMAEAFVKLIFDTGVRVCSPKATPECQR